MEFMKYIINMEFCRDEPMSVSGISSLDQSQDDITRSVSRYASEVCLFQ